MLSSSHGLLVRVIIPANQKQRERELASIDWCDILQKKKKSKNTETERERAKGSFPVKNIFISQPARMEHSRASNLKQRRSQLHLIIIITWTVTSLYASLANVTSIQLNFANGSGI